ncbi:MAG TPA: nucleotide exchange factor GrpE, partial [Buchnera sp. (in: enterobacteria)]|nr:nucleotide exchange factor GrpE [Buchnera sp. (in: enterobacteria)]
KNTTEIDKKEKKIIDLEKNILNIKNDINNIQLRGQAEIENIRKKSEKDIKIIKNTQLKEFSKKILPIIDALDEICTISAQNKIQETTMIQGIILTRKSMLNIIQKFGIKREGEKNTIFQPNLHQSVSSKISETIQSNHITAVIKHGYTLNGILLRKAIVETSL